MGLCCSAVRGKLVRGAAKHRLLAFQKVKLFKATTVAARDALRPDLFELRLHWTDDCCGERMRDNRNNRSSSGGSGSYLLMGTDDGHRLRPTFVMPWQAKRSKVSAGHRPLRLRLGIPYPVTYSYLSIRFDRVFSSARTSRDLLAVYLPSLLLFAP